MSTTPALPEYLVVQFWSEDSQQWMDFVREPPTRVRSYWRTLDKKSRWRAVDWIDKRRVIIGEDGEYVLSEYRPGIERRVTAKMQQVARDYPRLTRGQLGEVRAELVRREEAAVVTAMQLAREWVTT